MALIRRLEGSSATMYHDQAGLPTIGVGHLLTRDELSSGKLYSLGVRWELGLTEAQIELLLRMDIPSVNWAIQRYVTVPLTQNQYDSLASFVYNIGTHAFRESTLLKKLNTGDYTAVPEQMRRWVYSKGKRLDVLEKRREQEIALWSTT